jgi:peptide/nickel transport system permease protein
VTGPAELPSVGVADRVRSLGHMLRDLAAQPSLALAIGFLVLVAAAAVAPEIFGAGDPLRHNYGAVRLPPSPEHWLGTDQFGRDVFSRVVHGSRHSISAAIMAVMIGMITGSLIGVVAGVTNRGIDMVLMRFVDILLSVPSLIVSLAIVTALGRGTLNIAIAIGINSAAGFARVMRSEVLKTRAADFVEASVFAGHSWSYRVMRHIAPNASNSVVAMAVLDVGSAILAVSALSFLGFGAPPPTPEWGAMVSEGRNYLATDWWLTGAPGLAIILTALSVYRISCALTSTRVAMIG